MSAEDSSQGRLKITAVGSPCAGKTSLLKTYTTGAFPAPYEPLVFENYSGTIQVDGRKFDIALWDTAGQEDYAQIRPLSYPHTRCFLLCYSVACKYSFEEVLSKWVPEVRRYCPGVPLVLVGLRTDEREKNNLRHVTCAEATVLRDRVKAFACLECSAKRLEGVDEVFRTAVRGALGHQTKRPPRRTCLLL